MRTRITKMSAIGAAIGLALVASALTPAAAAPQPTAFTATNCSYFKGATTTGATAGFSGVALRTGDTITAVAGPAASSDTIFLSASLGLNLILAEGPATGYTFRAPADGVYALTFSLKSTSAPTAGVTWSFSANCSTTTVAPSPNPAPTKPGKGGGKGGGKG